MNIYSKKYKQEVRSDFEENTSISEVLAHPDLSSYKERKPSSSEEILSSGALPGVDAEKKSRLEQTKAGRMQAYMSLTSKTVAETRGWRIRAAYRLVTYMARITGDLIGSATLDGLFSGTLKADPSIHPFSRHINTKIYGTSHIADWLNDMSGITYLPPQDDKDLDKWCEAYNLLSDFLQVDKGTLDEPQSGVFGTVGMFNPDTAGFLWPMRDELLLYEQELLLHIFDVLCENSAQKVERMVMDKLGYSRPEAVMLVKTGLRYGTAVYQEDFDMNKIKELKSLEVLADVARDGEDPRAVLATRKQIALVSGLARTNEAESMDDFRELASRALEDDSDNLLLDSP